MSTKEPPTTMPKRIYEYMKTRGVEVSKGEICKALDVSHEAVRKTLTRLVETGVFIAIPDASDSGIVRYRLHEHATVEIKNGKYAVVLNPHKEEPKQEEPKQEEPKQEEPKQEEPKQEEPKQRSGTRGKGTGEFKDEGTGEIDFEYQRGYSNGYNDAMFHTQRDAYQAGKRVVIEGLLKILKVDAKVLMV